MRTIRVRAIDEAIAIIVGSVRAQLTADISRAIGIVEIDQSISIVIEAIVTNFNQGRTIGIAAIDEAIPVIVLPIEAVELGVGILGFGGMHVDHQLVGVGILHGPGGEHRDMTRGDKIPEVDEIAPIFEPYVPTCERRSRDLFVMIRP